MNGCENKKKVENVNLGTDWEIIGKLAETYDKLAIHNNAKRLFKNNYLNFNSEKGVMNALWKKQTARANWVPIRKEGQEKWFLTTNKNANHTSSVKEQKDVVCKITGYYLRWKFYMNRL